MTRAQFTVVLLAGVLTYAIRASFLVVANRMTELPHTVTTTSELAGTTHDTSGPDSFDEILPQGGEVRHTFETPGIYNYYCRPHAGLGMVGTIVVAG